MDKLRAENLLGQKLFFQFLSKCQIFHIKLWNQLKNIIRSDFWVILQNFTVGPNYIHVDTVPCLIRGHYLNRRNEMPKNICFHNPVEIHPKKVI